MSRLFYDDVMDWTIRVQSPQIDDLHEQLRGATVVNATNVSRYIDEDGRQAWDVTRDFPNLAPPWPCLWMDFRIPTLYSDTGGVMPLSHARAGMLLLSANVSDDARASTRLDGLRWVVSARAFVENWFLESRLSRYSQWYYDPGWQWDWGLNANGYMYTTPDKRLFFQVRPPDHALKVGKHVSPGDPPREIERFLTSAVMPSVFLALSLCHCKNVTVHTHDETTTHHARRQQRRWHARYYTLEIAPAIHMLRTQGASHIHGLRHALHVCRGHFKDYRQRGLFGKHKGLYWWDQHARGSVTTGIVGKDYAVVPPDGR